MDMKQLTLLVSAMLIALLFACTPSVPKNAEEVARMPRVYPDNTAAVLPPNIAPLNFRVLDECDEVVVRIHSNKTKEEIVVSGPDLDINVDDWHSLLGKAKGGNLLTDVYINKGDKWQHLSTIVNPVAMEPCDEFLTYRLIEPSYVDYEGMTINQRNITNFDERIIYSNRMQGEGDNGQCINCHVAQDYNRQGHSQFHIRQYNGGTMYIDGNGAEKVNLKTDSILSAGVYPAWHPKKDLIAYSVNETGQVFHTRDIQKIEVLDYASDLILYDKAANKVYDIDKRKDEFETFPAWNPTGDKLYYASAHYVFQGNDVDAELNVNYKSLKYNIYSRDFDAKNMKFGERRLVLDAASLGKSAAFPRISPDGRYVLVALSDFGQFHIWHKSSDLYVIDLKTGELRNLVDANSPESESYHNWSSNGRWIVFVSRREDGNYTRLYMSYFDKNGKAHKPVLLPQKSPDYYKQLFKSYNVPEWMVREVKIGIARMTNAVEKSAKPAEYAGSALASPETYQQGGKHVTQDKDNLYE